MTENEKETCSACGEDTASSEYLVCAGCADEHDAAVARNAREAALEEVREVLAKRLMRARGSMQSTASITTATISGIAADLGLNLDVAEK